MWLPGSGKTPKGKKPAWEAVTCRVTPPGGGARVIRLWRGAKGQERMFRGTKTLRKPGGAKTSKDRLRAKAREGAKNQ
jgi:hypothetical protein